MSIRSNASTLSDSFLEKESVIAKLWFAARWSASIFCDSIEEYVGCADSHWENEYDDEETVTILEEAPLCNQQANTKQGRVGEYHKSRSTQKRGKRAVKNEKEILSQFVQGNHRGWGTVRPSSHKNKNKSHVAKVHFLSDARSTMDEDSYHVLDYSSTYDSSRDGSCETRSYDEDSYQRYGKYSGSKSRSRGNDTSRRAAREGGMSNLDRECPSFGSKGSRLREHSRSFGSQSVSSSERSHSSTVAKSSFVTPRKMLSTYQSPSKPMPTKPTQSRGARMKAMQNSGSYKKISLGRQRVMARSTKERVQQRPKSIPYKINHSVFHVNHSIFHETLDNKKKRAMGHHVIEE